MKLGQSTLAISAAAAALLMLSACSGEDGANGTDGYSADPSTNSKVAFQEISAPVTNDEKVAIRTSEQVTYMDSGKTEDIGFTRLITTGDSNNGEVFGLVKDHAGEPATFGDGTPYICDGTNQAVGSGLDHSSILRVNNRVFMVNQFECEVGAMYGMELEQKDGTLAVKADSMQFIDQIEGFGGWVHCAGMTTPWESHLGSEEYEPNARNIEANPTGDKYFNEVTTHYWNGVAADNNPYYYGYIPEVTVDATEKTPTFNYTKHFSMGRAAWEMAYVMPDEKTAYLSDDGTNVGFYMYVADEAKNLSAGTLYAAKWIQTSSVGAGAADIMWVKLGHATDAEIKAIVSTKPKFSDIFYVQSPDENDTCPTGYSYANTVSKECLRVKTGKEKAAAFLETRRYAAVVGATTEFRKEEGVTFDPEHNRLYVAMSQVAKGMSDTAGDVQLAQNSCGAVYGFDINGENQTAVDSDVNAINSNYVVVNQYAVVEGAPASYPAGSAYGAYGCSVNGIANPDNVAYMAGTNLLLIGEDTDYHPNDFIWTYDVVTGKLTRILTAPFASETTSPFLEKDVFGKDYITTVIQHPFGETFDSTDPDEQAFDDLATAASDSEKRSFVGVVGPFNFK